MTPGLRYVLVTPARNEESFLELTIQSMVAQTVRPAQWVIVSDGSTDRTEEIARAYAAQHAWIAVVSRPPRTGRHFGAKVDAFNAGRAALATDDYAIIGSLDADLSFCSDFFEFLLARFAEDPKLGVAGAPFEEEGTTYDYRFSSQDHVSGACQLFRRECYDDIGGYKPLEEGGIDVVAVLTARMKGWRTRTFTERHTVHHRPMGTATAGSKFSANFKLGRRAYRMGFHPMWQVFRSMYQMTRPPYVSGGAALTAGYFWAMVSRTERAVGPDVMAFQRADQLRRLRTFFTARLSRRGASR